MNEIMYSLQGGEEVEELISDEEDAPPSTPKPPPPVAAPPPPPPHETQSYKEADLLNLGFSSQGTNTQGTSSNPATDTLVSDVNLLDISTSSKQDPSNFDLLSGFSGSDGSKTDTSATTTQENLFDPFGTEASTAVPPQGGTTPTNLFAQFGIPQQQQQQPNPFVHLGTAVSMINSSIIMFIPCKKRKQCNSLCVSFAVLLEFPYPYCISIY